MAIGRIAPVSTMANVLASMEALTGLLASALATSLMFARFSRPDARVLYSRQAIVAPYRGINGLMFRNANERNNQLIQVGVQVLLSRFEKERWCGARSSSMSSDRSPTGRSSLICTAFTPSSVSLFRRLLQYAAVGLIVVPLWGIFCNPR